ncbi:MAG: class I SAM-dependent methyltransferase [Chitinophagaceae bacterium]|nr:class I SAM-dependent methyltransferase [Chitinophagaceae bacterium]
MKAEYIRKPDSVLKGKNREIAVFNTAGENIDHSVVEAFGEEWLKFQDYDDETIRKFVLEYFDIITDEMVNKDTYMADIGCGTGRWSKYMSTRCGYIEAIDPSNALIAADNLLKGIENIRLTKASTETVPFADDTFDFVMSIGVLHHIPNTQKAMMDCVKKVKKGGYFYTYLYYNLENRGAFFRFTYTISNIIRLGVCRLPAGLKRFVCDILAATIYLPIVSLVRFLYFIGAKKLGDKLPLTSYKNKNFFVLRNDALDRFGTALEQRFSKKQVIEMMEFCGLENIIVSPNSPYYHAVGKKK